MSGDGSVGGAVRPAARRAAFAVLLALIVSLALMKPAFRIAGLPTASTDVIFLVLAACWLTALAAGQARLRWEPAYAVILLYLGALGVSSLVSADPLASAVKMATQAYLAGLAFLAASLVRDGRDLRQALSVWLAATAVVAAVGAASLALFLADPDNPLLKLVRFHFGTLPPGHYPRFSLTFGNANMLCNYLSVSLMILLATRALGWIGKTYFALLLAGLLMCAALTISPGIGGVVLVGGLWLWLLLRPSRPRLAALLLLAAGGAAVAFVAAMALTPILHPTAPWLVPVPGTDLTLAPAGRMLTWTAAAREFAAHPWLGHGIGIDAVQVRYLDPSGYLQRLTDAHNGFLNVAAQAGVVGVSGMLLLLLWVARQARPFRLRPDRRNAVRLALALAFLGGFAYQGLGGSFEDARHLWVLLGLLIAAARIEREATALEASGSDH